MKMKLVRQCLWLVGTALVMVGCGTPKPKPIAWNVSITKTTPSFIEVDLIGVNAFEKPAWEGYDLDKYWKPGDPRRRNADKLTMNLPTGTPWIVKRDDPKWQSWLKRSTELLLIANLPGRFPPGPSDPRRVFISLDKKATEAKHRTLEIEVQDDLVRVMTRQKPHR